MIYKKMYHPKSSSTSTSKTVDQTVRPKRRHLGFTLVLTFNHILSTPDCVDVFIVPILHPNRPQMHLFWPRNIDLMRNCPLKPRISHSPSAFRSGTSAPFLGQNKLYLRAVRGSCRYNGLAWSFWDLASRVGWNYCTLNINWNHDK
jgi:hypothetical protein